MQDKKTFGSYIATKRKEANLTQKSFAEQLHVTESAVSKWENGLSYPDILLLRRICDILHITEHELLTATEDTETRDIQRSARNYKRLVNIYHYSLLSLYSLAVVVCFICNLAIDKKLSWFFVVLTSIAVAFSVTLLPLYVKKHTGFIVLGSFTASLFLLLFVCNMFSGGTWVVLVMPCLVLGLSLCFLPFILRAIPLPKFLQNQKTLLYMTINTILIFLMLLSVFIYLGELPVYFATAMPITLFSLTLPWALFLIIRYIKCNAYLKTFLCLASSAVFFQFINAFIVSILGDVNQGKTPKISFIQDRAYSDYIGGDINVIIMASLLVLTVIFALIGLIRARKNAQ